MGFKVGFGLDFIFYGLGFDDFVFQGFKFISNYWLIESMK